MNKLIYPSIMLLMAMMVIVISSCEENETPEDNSFDRTIMLENMAQNIIIPAYSDLKSKLATLKVNAENFTQNPNLNSLNTLQNSWEQAYISWQFANAFNFGPAGEQGLRRGLIEEVGTFPVSTEKIESAIMGIPNFKDFNRDARGFLAVEYLIFGLDDSPIEIVQGFSSEGRKDFLLNAILDIESRVTEVLTAWNDGYGSEFVRNNGTDVGSGTSMLYNEFVKSFESIKNFKLGLPLGKRPGQIQAEPQLVEAYYSSKSLTMIEKNLNAIENIWNGHSREGQEGLGFREYLESVVGGQALITATESQMAEIKLALAAIPKTTPLSEQIQNSPAPAERLHTELQKHTRFYKSDMSSLLGISITFSSGDGD